MADLFPQFVLVTQNVDGLHQRAGSPRVIELHGNIHRAKCIEHNHPCSYPDCDTDCDTDIDVQPRCNVCDSLIRPDVVWFGESLPQEGLQLAIDAARESDFFFSVGTSSVVYPAAGMAQLAADNGATIIEINPNQTPLTSQADFAIRASAAKALPAIVDELVDAH